MQALMAEAQASAAKAAAEREKEAAQRALKAKNLPVMLRGAKLNITGQAPVKGNALQEAAAKAPPPQTSTPKAGDGANGLARSGETVNAVERQCNTVRCCSFLQIQCLEGSLVKGRRGLTRRHLAFPLEVLRQSALPQESGLGIQDPGTLGPKHPQCWQGRASIAGVQGLGRSREPSSCRPPSTCRPSSNPRKGVSPLHLVLSLLTKSVSSALLCCSAALHSRTSTLRFLGASYIPGMQHELLHMSSGMTMLSLHCSSLAHFSKVGECRAFVPCVQISAKRNTLAPAPVQLLTFL